MKTIKVLPARGVGVIDVAYAKAHGKYRLTGRKLYRIEIQDLKQAADDGSEVYVDRDGTLALPKKFVGKDVIVRRRNPIEPEDKFYVEAWVAQEKPAEVPAMGDAGSYFRARVREGGLVAADEETARVCGVRFAKSGGKK